MSNVIVDKNKIDILANAISVKSGEPVTMTLAEMVEAVDRIEVGGGTPTLETVTKTYTPSTSAVTDTITPSSGYDGIEEVDVTVSAVPIAQITLGTNATFSTANNQRKWKVRGTLEVDVGEEGYISEGSQAGAYTTYNAIATGTSVTPTESSQTIGGTNYMMEGAVTVNAIPSNYVGSGITSRSSLDLSASGATVTAPAGYYASSATKTVASGTDGTPTASKGAVINHAIAVTPSVTNTTGYITGSTKTGTAVSVSASELVSGNLAITQNGTGIDVTNYSTVSVDVSGGGGSSMAVGSDAAYPNMSKVVMFTSMLGEPTSFYLMALGDIATSSTPKVAAVVYDGTNVLAQTITNTSNAQVSYNSTLTTNYNSAALSIIIPEGTNAVFDENLEYQLVYTYGGSSANIGTADVQVGSGATSITFTGLEDEPTVWSCIFKSNFSTSSGYQRVIFVGLDDTSSITGLEMDSGAHLAQHWTASYNNGSLTITSSGTNQGGYFHQPGYYQLTYAIGDPSPYEKKSVTYRASTSAQTDKIEPSTGYDAMSEVNITIPAVSQTNLTAANIKSGTTVTISNGSTNLWSVTGTYSGGGGGANIATATMTNSSNQNTSIEFTLPSGRTPIAFFARLTSQIARNSNSRYYYVFDMRWDGSSTGGVAGNTFYMSSGTLTNVTSGYSYSQSGTTFTLSSTGSRSASPGSFYNGNYELVYVY